MAEKHLLILETVKDAKSLLNKKSTIPISLNELDIISTQPDIQAYLLKNNIICKNSADYMHPGDYSIINNKVEIIEKFISDCIRRKNQEIPSSWVTNSFTYYFRYLCYYLFWDILLISNALSGNQYKSIIAFELNENFKCSPWVLPEERYLGEIARRIAKHRHIEFLRIPLIGKKKNNKVHLASLRKIINIIGFNIYLKAAKKFAKEKSILIPSTSKNMHFLCAELLKNDSDLKFCKLGAGTSLFTEITDLLQIGLYCLFNHKMVDKVKTVKIDLKLPLYTIALNHSEDYKCESISTYVFTILNRLDTESKNLTLLEKVNLIDLIAGKTKNDILTYLLDQDFLSFGLKKGLTTLQPNFIISQVAVNLGSALGYISTEFDIPSVLISHGSHVKHEDKYSAREHEILANNILVGGYRYLGVQSPLAKEMAEQAKSGSETIINIHPVIWGRKVKKNKPHFDKLTIVHAGTFKPAARRFMYETSDEMLKGLTELTDGISDKENLEMVIKFRADPEFSLDSLNLLLSPLPENVIVDNESLFLDVLGKADLLVSFSSTTIEEALVNDIPVLLYGGGGRYAHIPVAPYKNGDAVEKAVTFIKRKEQLIDYFTALNQKSSSFTVPSEEFDPYRFKKGDAVEFSDWFANKMKPEATA